MAPPVTALKSALPTRPAEAKASPLDSRPLWLAAFTGSAFLVLATQGLLPSLRPTGLSVLLPTGAVECLANTFPRSLVHGCTDLGGPAGAPFLIGLPQISLSWLVSSLPIVDAEMAVLAVMAFCSLAGLAAGYRLLRMATASKLYALIGSLTYQTSLSVLGMAAFPYTSTGYILLPAYTLVAVWATQRICAGGRRTGAAAYLSLALLMAFQDGYSYITGSTMFILLAGLTNMCSRRRWEILGTFLAANAVAVAAYLMYIPAGSQEPAVGLGAFRFLGLDPLTMLIPSSRVWWGELAETEATIAALWGDGSNTQWNYLGITTVLLAVLACVLRTGRIRLARALVFTGGACLLLALGPDLKFASQTFPINPEYDVPASALITTLPTALLYEHAPGFEDMRATYRWYVVTRFCLIAAAILGAVAIHRAGRPLLALGLTAIMVIETGPNLSLVFKHRGANADNIAAVRQDVFNDAQRSLVAREKVLFLPATNDLLINALAPAIDVRTYNVGIDKNQTLARASWPTVVLETALCYGSERTGDRIEKILDTGLADAVVVQHYNPFLAAQTWPPAASEASDGLRRFAAMLAADPRFAAQEEEWITTLRLSRDSDFTGPRPAETAGESVAAPSGNC